MKVLASNPCDAIERPGITPGMPRGLTADDIRRLLAVLPETPVGMRDRAIILMLTFTGRRRSGVLNLTAGDLNFEGSTVYYSYRGKGGKTGRRELPQPGAGGPAGLAGRIWARPRRHAPNRLALAVSRRRARDHERDLLRQPAPVSQESWAAHGGRPHLPTLGGQAQA
jgi:site-specific recombinase XerC